MNEKTYLPIAFFNKKHDLSGHYMAEHKKDIREKSKLIKESELIKNYLVEKKR